MKVNKIDITQFGERLKEIRKEKNMSMDKFCELFNKATDSNLNKSTVSRWEKGEREPYMSSLQLLADFFCVPLPWLMGVSDIRVESTDEQDTELLDIFHGLSVRDRAKLLTFACELEEAEKNGQH